MFTTTFTLDDDQKNYIESISGDKAQDYITALENEEFDKVGDINLLIKLLFATNKTEDAWTHIRKNLKIVDFMDIFQCPYMQMDRTATDVYKYMYDNNIIDDNNYMYFEVLSGKLNDWEFWKKKFEDKSTTEIFEILNGSYNGVLKATDINPYQIGLVTLTEEQEEYIFDKLQPNEKLDFVLADKPSINFTPNRLVSLIINNNLSHENSGIYFRIVLLMYSEMYDVSADEYKEFYYNFFNTIRTYAKDDYDFRNIVDDMKLDTLDKLFLFLDWYHDTFDQFEHDADTSNNSLLSYDLLYFSINNTLFLEYTHTILNHLAKYAIFDEYAEDGIWKDCIYLGNYLNADKNLSMLISYKLHPLIDTSDYILNYVYPTFPMVYSKIDNMMLFGDKVLPYDEKDDIFDFVDNYLVSETIDEKLYEKVESSKEKYKELVYAAKKFNEDIQTFLG